VVIGTGVAGLVAALEAHRRGQKVMAFHRRRRLPRGA
jgi:succinate dehydrogenase/fumarate reductase flavoprotein subunit